MMINRRSLFAVSATVAALLIGLSAPDATAQRGGQGGFGGGMMMGGMMGGPGGRGRMTDPSVSNIMTLIYRTDVRTEITLTASQREQLEGMQQKSGQEFGQKMRANMPDWQGMRNLPAEERQQKMQEFQQQMQSNVQEFVGGMDEKAAKILRTAQMTRLRQLDYQWRGPLAMTDNTIADKVGLDNDQKGKLREIMQEFRTQQGEQMRSIFMGGAGAGAGANGNAAGGTTRANRRNRNQNGQAATPPGSGAGAAPGGAPGAAPGTQAGGRPNFNPEEIQAKMAEAMKAIDVIRKELGEKVLTLLNDDQKASWKVIQGKKFAFRVND